MPVVTFERQDICRILGQDVPLDTLVERMPMLGGDIDKVDGDAITIEWFPDRPDLLTLEGTGRAMRAFLGIRPGLDTFDIAGATTTLTVDASVQGVRPYAALCFVRGVPFDDAYLQTVIDAQEKLTLAPGRKRRKIAIGIHDAADIEGPFTYTCVGPDDKAFEPLAWEGGPMTPAEIMANHPKGQEYGHLLPDDRFPVFLDGHGDVLSLPPVINAAKTTVTADTSDLLVDVTGSEPTSVRATIALLAVGFAERGGIIEAVEVEDASGKWTCPDMQPKESVLHVDDVTRWLGMELSAGDMASALQRTGHHAEDYDNKVLVRSPAWRFDLLHAVDLMEDIAIGHGYENFPGAMPQVVTFGGLLPHQTLEDALRQTMTGLGFHEVRTLTLSNPDDQWTKWGADASEHAPVKVRNPVLEEQTLLRAWLVPSLLGVLRHNRHRSLPQRLFEIGYAVDPDDDPDGPPRNTLRLAAVELDAKAGFSSVKGLVESVIRNVGLDATMAPGSAPGFIAGREGVILAGDRPVGHFGELHPDTITAFELGAATVAMECTLDPFA